MHCPTLLLAFWSCWNSLLSDLFTSASDIAPSNLAVVGKPVTTPAQPASLGALDLHLNSMNSLLFDFNGAKGHQPGERHLQHFATGSTAGANSSPCPHGPRCRIWYRSARQEPSKEGKAYSEESELLFILFFAL